MTQKLLLLCLFLYGIAPLQARRPVIRDIERSRGESSEILFSEHTSPDYTTRDDRPDLKNNGYRMDTVVLNGWIKNRTPRQQQTWTTIKFSVYDPMNLDDMCNYETEMDSLGRFTMKIPVWNSSLLDSDWKRLMIRTVIEPGETYHLVYDLGTGDKYFTGDDVRLQNELLAHPMEWIIIPMHLPSKATGEQLMEYLRQLEQQKSAVLHRLDSTLQAVPTLSTRYERFMRNWYDYAAAWQLSQVLYLSADKEVPTPYLEAIRQVIDRRAQPYLAYYYYPMLLRDYISYYRRKAVYPSMLAYMRTGAQLCDSLGLDSIARDLILCDDAHTTFDMRIAPLHDDEMDFLRTEIHNPEAWATLERMQRRYEQLREVKLQKEVNLRNSVDVSGLTEGEAILRRLLEPMQGRVVLIDVWGTWCAPCRKALKQFNQTATQLSDCPVAYLFLANRSEQEPWQNLIKEYDLTGENIFHYNLPKRQQDAIESFLMISKYPSYRLVDRHGNIITMSMDFRNSEIISTIRRLCTEE
jgi:thiol-disulfide isomerase/thioredoxin